MEQIDEILIQLEDQLHGELGNLVTKARKLLAAKTSPPSMPDEISDEAIERHFPEMPGKHWVRTLRNAKVDAAKWMRSQCDGLIKQKAVEFAEWTCINQWCLLEDGLWYNQENEDVGKTTTELYEIFNQQER